MAINVESGKPADKWNELMNFFVNHRPLCRVTYSRSLYPDCFIEFTPPECDKVRIDAENFVYAEYAKDNTSVSIFRKDNKNDVRKYTIPTYHYDCRIRDFDAFFDFIKEKVENIRFNNPNGSIDIDEDSKKISITRGAGERRLCMNQVIRKSNFLAAELYPETATNVVEIRVDTNTYEYAIILTFTDDFSKVKQPRYDSGNITPNEFVNRVTSLIKKGAKFKHVSFNDEITTSRYVKDVFLKKVENENTKLIHFDDIYNHIKILKDKTCVVRGNGIEVKMLPNFIYELHIVFDDDTEYVFKAIKNENPNGWSSSNIPKIFFDENYNIHLTSARTNKLIAVLTYIND